jgi:hypothetical protein
VCKEITANQIMVWPKKKKISSAKLSVRYAILNRIAAVNWVPTTHSFDIATGLGKFIYVVGSKSKMDFGTYILNKLSSMPKLMLEQHPCLINAADVPEKREPPLTLHPKLFSADHVLDIVGTSGSALVAGTMTKQEIVAALKDTCVMMDERKDQFELMIHSLEGESADADEQAENEEGVEDSDSSSEASN